MNLGTYIVKQGTPESKLLSRAGFDRMSLPVAEWQGKRRSRGGFGRAPVAWRVEGQENVKKLCQAIVFIIGRKQSSTLSDQEKSTLGRAKKTLKAFDNRIAKAETTAAVAMSREKSVRLFLAQRFPCASTMEIDDACNDLAASSFYSLEEMESRLNVLLAGKVSAWEDAVHAFVDVMAID
jgi:hypothetical protein